MNQIHQCENGYLNDYINKIIYTIDMWAAGVISSAYQPLHIDKNENGNKLYDLIKKWKYEINDIN